MYWDQLTLLIMIFVVDVYPIAETRSCFPINGTIKPACKSAKGDTKGLQYGPRLKLYLGASGKGLAVIYVKEFGNV